MREPTRHGSGCAPKMFDQIVAPGCRQVLSQSLPHRDTRVFIDIFEFDEKVEDVLAPVALAQQPQSTVDQTGIRFLEIGPALINGGVARNGKRRHLSIEALVELAGNSPRR